MDSNEEIEPCFPQQNLHAMGCQMRREKDEMELKSAIYIGSEVR